MKIVLFLVLALTLCACSNQATFIFDSRGNNKGELKLLKVNAPIYPTELLNNLIEGYVFFEFSVNEKGKVEDIKIVSEYPAEIFRRAAYDSLLSSKYRPKFINGQPVKAEGETRRVSFLINGKSVNDVELHERNCRNSSPKWVEALKCKKIQ